MSMECSHLQLERYLGGELPPAQLKEVRQHLESCSDCSSYMAHLEAERIDFLQKHPFVSFTRAHAAVVELPWYRTVFNYIGRPALIPLYGALLIILVAIPSLYRINRPLPSDVRFKGTQPISFLFQRDGVIQKGSTTLIYRANDKIQISYSLVKERYVSLLSVDADGTISFYHPDQQAVSCSIFARTGDSQSFPGSIVLDDTPGDELIVVLFSDISLQRGDVEKWASDLFKKSPDLEKIKNRLKRSQKGINAEVATLLLRKE